MSAITLGRQRATTAVMVVLFWGVAALLVAATHQTIEPITPVGSVVAKVCAIVLIAFAYVHLTVQKATLDHALFVGVVWLLLTIAGEIAMTMLSHRGWYDLLGSPASALRNVVMFAWVAAPALFARNRP
jgi:hypothetical protein